MSDASIRTPAWGVTVGKGVLKWNDYFNSHPRMGGDPYGIGFLGRCRDRPACTFRLADSQICIKSAVAAFIKKRLHSQAILCYTYSKLIAVHDPLLRRDGVSAFFMSFLRLARLIDFLQ